MPNFFSTIGYYPANYKSAFDFYNLYRQLKTVEEQSSFNDMAFNALEELEKVEKSNDNEL